MVALYSKNSRAMALYSDGVSWHRKLGPVCRAKFEAEALARRAHQGGLNQGVQMEVCRALRRLGLVVELRVSCMRSGLVLEILALQRGVNDACWVLEGHRHTLSWLWSLKGEVIIKRRQIELLGYSLIILSEDECIRAHAQGQGQGQGHTEMDSYLRTKLLLARPPHPHHLHRRPPPLAGLSPSVEMRLQGLFTSGHASHEVKEAYCMGKRDLLYG